MSEPWRGSRSRTFGRVFIVRPARYAAWPMPIIGMGCERIKLGAISGGMAIARGARPLKDIIEKGSIENCRRRGMGGLERLRGVFSDWGH